MNSESSSAEEPRDRMRWIWLGVIALIVLAGLVLWLLNRTDPAISQARVRHILIKFDKQSPESRAQAYETITRLRERIASGESMSTLAREYSNDNLSAARGGDLGYVKKGTLSDNVERYVWSANLNTLSDIIESQYGFHLVTVLNRYLSSADRYQQELEERVLREMEQEKAAQPAAPAESPAPPPLIAQPPAATPPAAETTPPPALPVEQLPEQPAATAPEQTPAPEDPVTAEPAPDAESAPDAEPPAPEASVSQPAAP